MKHLKRLGWGLFTLVVFAIMVGVMVGIGKLAFKYPYVGVPLVVLGIAYFCGWDIENDDGHLTKG